MSSITNLRKLFVSLALLVFSALLFNSCSHYEELKRDVEESSANSDESHNAGKNCGSCHNQNGHEAAGEGKWWTVSGTVYDTFGKPLPGIAVELWEKPGKQGKLLRRIVSDKHGNFYTNQIIAFGSGCYPVITASNGAFRTMVPAYSGGSCNSCHGVSTGKITIQP